ncbi:MAG: ccr4 associated factor [Claussenomyces sp. TS43310]|nr:MAG: ccr4 associated factor [Claussenomyces sp. TS43310]
MKPPTPTIARASSHFSQRGRVSAPYICQACLSLRSAAAARRRYSTSPSPPPLTSPPASGYSALPSRRLISLSGPDAAHFLQGVVTPNITPQASRARATTAASSPQPRGFYGAFLNAHGRLIYDVFIYADLTTTTAATAPPGERWFLEVDAEQVEKLYKHIRKYKLRSKFELRLIPADEMAVWSVWGDARDAASSLHLPASVVGCEDLRAPGMGVRVALPTGRGPEVDAEESSETAYRIRRYLKGVPEGQRELIQESALPQESNIDYMGGLDYRKGCYVGQELTIRTHHTGVVRKRVLPVMFYEKREPMPTSLIFKSVVGNVDAEVIPRGTSIGRVEKSGRSAGKLLAGIGNVGLGLCRLEIMTGLSNGGEAGRYKEGDEFKLEWQSESGSSQMAKVKAFVPPWHPNQ